MGGRRTERARKEEGVGGIEDHDIIGDGEVVGMRGDGGDGEVITQEVVIHVVVGVGRQQDLARRGA